MGKDDLRVSFWVYCCDGLWSAVGRSVVLTCGGGDDGGGWFVTEDGSGGSGTNTLLFARRRRMRSEFVCLF